MSPTPQFMDGTMFYRGHRVRVIEATAGEREGRKGWWAFDAWAVETGIGMQDAKLFYPGDMFIFEPTEEETNHA